MSNFHWTEKPTIVWLSMRVENTAELVGLEGTVVFRLDHKMG